MACTRSFPRYVIRAMAIVLLKVFALGFRIVFLLGIRSYLRFVGFCQAVVNCFQNCIFTWHSQYIDVSDVVEISCELLSELYFYLAFAVL